MVDIHSNDDCEIFSTWMVSTSIAHIWIVQEFPMIGLIIMEDFLIQNVLHSDFPRNVRFRCHKGLKSPYGGKKRERTRKEDEERKWVRSWEEDSVADVCTVHVHGIKLKSRSIADACRWMHSKKFHRKQSKIWNITQKLEWMANNGKSLMFLTRHTRTNGYTVASCVGGGRRRAWRAVGTTNVGNKGWRGSTANR